MMIEVMLWFLAGLVAYTYAGYPLLLAAVAAVRPRAVVRSAIAPSVTVIIAAFNEERDIARKLEMVLAMEYPTADRQIIVASDCSTDRTHEIVEGFAGRGVELVVLSQRGGKTVAQNLAVSRARGDILVFTDATTALASNAIRKLVEPFADPRVGCTGAQLQYQSSAGTAVGRGGRLYWRYETLLKKLESRANSLIGVSGCLYAVRRALYVPIAPDLISDFVIALDIFARGHVSLYVPDAVALEKTHERADREFAMRSRVVVRSINALVQRARLLDPFRAGFFALQLWSHKILRYLVPELVIAVFVLSIWLGLEPGPRAPFYRAFALLQLATYGVVPAAYLFCRRFNIRTGVLSAPFYFILANAAALWALISYLRGVRDVTWTTVR
jgi:cellulose synthase/poly-beta-1,6-N-acetylglucosamine synthase-like glycosyltransferase